MTIISLTHNFSIKLILILSLFITSFTMTFASVLEGTVWMDNGCLGGPIGCPIEGAHISATGELGGIVPESYESSSGEMGHYAMELPAGYYHVTCSKEGWQTQEEFLYVGENGAVQDFHLPESGDNPDPQTLFFSGHVFGNAGSMLPAFMALEGAHIEVMGGSDWGFELYFETESNEDGYFEFEYEFTPGGAWFTNALVKISADGYETLEEEMNFSDPVLDHEFFLNPTTDPEPTDVYFSGHVFATYPNSTGLPTPIDNAHVNLYGGITGGLLVETETNDEGYFEFGDVVMAAQSYSIEAEGYYPIDGWIWDFCNTIIDPSTDECFPIYSDFYLEPMEDEFPENSIIFGQVSAQISPMGPVFPLAGVQVVASQYIYTDSIIVEYETETGDNGHYELEVPNSQFQNAWTVTVTTEYGEQTQMVYVEPGYESEVNFHFNAWDNNEVPVPYELTAELEWMPLGAMVLLNWHYEEFNIDSINFLPDPVFNVYADLGWNYQEWELVGETTETHFEYGLGEFFPNDYEFCFKVKAVLNGMESESSNIACVVNHGPDPTDCEDLSNYHFGDCEMIIGIGWNGEECTEFSGCGTIDQDGVNHANSFFESWEECQDACDVNDDGPPECIMDCEGFYDIDPSVDADGTCSWLIEALNSETECTSDCDEETLGFLMELSGLCEECLEGHFDCADIFDDNDGDDGPPECIMDCEGIEDINPEADPYGACEWFIEISGSECIADCDPSSLMILNQVTSACEQCLDGAFDCADVFDEPEGGDGYLYGYVEYIWGDAIEMVAGALVLIQGIDADGSIYSVYETHTNEMGSYEIALPQGAYLVTAHAYDETQTHDVFIESGHETELNFTFGEFWWPEVAITGVVMGGNLDSTWIEIGPISEAHVEALGLTTGSYFETWTDDAGNFYLNLEFPGVYEVTVSREGYESVTQTVEVWDLTFLEFFLEIHYGGEDPVAVMYLGNGSGVPGGSVTVPLYLTSDVPVGGVQFTVWPQSAGTSGYLMPSGLESTDECFSASYNEIYGQLVGIIFSLEGCVYGAGENFHIADLTFDISDGISPGAEIALIFNETLVSDPVGQEIPSSGEGGAVLIGLAGDVNGDSDINVLDIVTIVSFALQSVEPSDYEFWAADVNGDDAINILDVVLVVNIILYADEMGRVESDIINVAHSSSQVIISGNGIAGFQLEYDRPISLQGVDIPELWQVSIHNDQLIAYRMGGQTIDHSMMVRLNSPAELRSVIISNAHGEAMQSSMQVLPEQVSLYQNYPNPFNPETRIRYDLVTESQVELSIYDVSGRLIETLQNGLQTSGQYTVNWSASDLPSGMYLARLIVDNQSFTHKMMLMK